MLRRRMLIMLGVVIVIVLILAALKFNSIRQQIQQFKAPKPPVSVEVEPARQLEWQERLQAIGTLRATQGIDLTSEVTGTVSELAFESGEQVERGQLLVQLDAAVEQASLATAQADLRLARAEQERGRSLLARQALAKSEFDRLDAQLSKADAAVAQLQASLAKKRILAPFAGTIGIRQVDLGDFLAAGTPIATLQDLSTLYVDFFLPEQHVPRIATGQNVQVEVAAYPGQTFTGKVVALNPKVEPTTRNVQVRATLANPDDQLLPGMFAEVQLLLPQQAPKVVVPETAVSYSLYGSSVLLVSKGTPPEGTEAEQPYLVIERRFVEPGERREGRVVIDKGLEPGEQVVVAGQLKLDSGTHISVATERTLELD